MRVLPKTIHRLAYLDITGSYGVIHDITRLAAVIAYTSAEMAFISIDHARQWIEGYSRFILELSASITNRMYKQDEYISYCTKYSALRGVISMILDEWEIFNRKADPGEVIRLQYAQQETGEAIGKNIRSVNRAIQKLKQLNDVEADDNRIYFRRSNLDALNALRIKEISDRSVF